MALSSKLAVSVTADLTKTLDLAEARVPLAKAYQMILSSGVAAGMADKIFHDTRTLAASATEDLDLAGVLLDPLGDVLTFVKIKGLVVVAAGAPGPPAVPNVNNVVVGAAAANPWAALLNATGTVQLRPGAALAVFAGAADGSGYAVTPGTGDLLKIANGGAGTSVTYDIIILGTSA